MAIADRESVSRETAAGLERRLCVQCRLPVLVVRAACEVYVVELREWEPRASCERCARTRAAWPGKRINCARCGDTGYVGVRRPAGAMLAVDVAWSDEFHVRVIGPRTDRRRGEGLHAFHACGGNALL